MCYGTKHDEEELEVGVVGEADEVNVNVNVYVAELLWLTSSRVTSRLQALPAFDEVTVMSKKLNKRRKKARRSVRLANTRRCAKETEVAIIMPSKPLPCELCGIVSRRRGRRWCCWWCLCVRTQ